MTKKHTTKKHTKKAALPKRARQLAKFKKRHARLYEPAVAAIPQPEPEPPPPVAPAMPVPPPPPAINQDWRKAIDWVAAGKKAYESRLRNLAAKMEGNGGSVVASPARPSRVNGPDPSVEAYMTRLLALMARSTRKDDVARVAEQVGRDLGAGWIILGTDGTRALTRKATKAEAKAPTTPRPIIPAGPPTFHFPITPAFEEAVRIARHGLPDNKKEKPELRLAVDAKRKTVTVTSAVTPTGIAVPVTGKLLTSDIRCNARFLAEAFGRGGSFGWTPKPDKPLLLDTDDQLRYVLMPVISTSGSRRV
jgi:hypothetical protein